LKTILADRARPAGRSRAERKRENMLPSLTKRAAESDLRLKRLYDAIESGVSPISTIPNSQGPHRRSQGDHATRPGSMLSRAHGHARSLRQP
jgi:hypothetical protein